MDTCGAKTRAGTPCKQKAIYGNGRCMFHGGLATGPTTEAGKEQCRINGRKGGRPRKDGALLKNVNVSEAIATEVIEPQGNPKVVPDTKVSIRVSASLPPSDTKVLQRVPDAQAPISSAPKTEIMETDKTIVSEALPGKDSVRVPITDLQEPVHPKSSPEKPKSWESRKVMVSAICERCTMFASNGACLAMAKGRIASMPTGENCAAFSAF